MAIQTRPYKVTTPDGAVRFVRAAHPSQAISFVVAKANYKAEVANINEVIDHMARGGRIEESKPEQMKLPE